MEGLAKRYFWVFNLIALALLAFLTARVINNVIAGKIAALPTNPTANKVGTLASDTGNRNHRDWAEMIANRNLFNSDPPEPVDPFEGDDAGVEDAGLYSDGWGPLPGQPCDESDAKVGLLATMVAEPRDWSMAVIDDPEADDSRLMKERQELAGMLLVSIQRDRIVLGKGNKFECVNLGTKAKGGRRKASTRRGRETDQSIKPVGKDDFKGAVKKVGKNQYEIDRGMLNEKLEDLSALSRGARVIPHYRDGKPQGFKVVGVRPGSMYSHIGVRSGDVIKAVGDEEITSPSKALELYERLKNSDNVTVDIERRGRKMTLEYAIK